MQVQKKEAAWKKYQNNSQLYEEYKTEWKIVKEFVPQAQVKVWERFGNLGNLW